MVFRMEKETEGNGYFKWLCDKIGCNGARKKLIRQLYSIDFTYKISNDVNRLSDGAGLRDLYQLETGRPANADFPISVLEVLIGLSKRLAEDVLGDQDNTGLSAVWFWRMLENLGVMKYVGGKYDRGAVCIIIERWMSRDFTPRGKGSPFPLKRANDDQRKVEIWSQVMNYLAENPQYEDEV